MVPDTVLDTGGAIVHSKTWSLLSWNFHCREKRVKEANTPTLVTTNSDTWCEGKEEIQAMITII